MNKNQIKVCFLFFFMLAVSLILLESNYQFLSAPYKIVRIHQWIYNASLYDQRQTQIVYQCNIFTNETNSKFRIDGKLYPNIIPIYHNKSIDFNCLNKKSRNAKKTILLWTKFKGMLFIFFKIYTFESR